MKGADSLGLVTRREALARVAWLLGGAVSAPTVSGVLAGCGRTGSNGAGSAARVLSADQAELVAVIAEHIVPETDTPGARTTRVPEFIDEMLAEYYSVEERDRFLAGLTDVDDRAVAAHGAAFVECSPEQQLALLTELDRDAFAPPPGAGDSGSEAATDEQGAAAEPSREPVLPVPPAELDPSAGEWVWGEAQPVQDTDVPFMRSMKELTLVGYYTSEIGATQELRHEPVPGRFDGCVPFAEIGRTWAV